jgi:hypothetical protein
MPHFLWESNRTLLSAKPVVSQKGEAYHAPVGAPKLEFRFKGIGSKAR